MDARGILRVLVPGVTALTRCEGTMWPTAFVLEELSSAEEVRIVALGKKAVN